MLGWAVPPDVAQHEQVQAFYLVSGPGCSAQKLQAGCYAGLALKTANLNALSQFGPAIVGR